MKKINIFRLMVFLFVAFGLTSCDKGGEPDAGGTALETVAGDWIVDIAQDGVIFATSELLSTYNTSANLPTEMWIDDNQHGFWIKAKVNLDLESQTFSGTNLEENYDPGVTVTVTDGIIVTDGGTSPTGAPVDTISFNAEFSNDPGVIYGYSGIKKTGFLGDE